jgi:hypothetical protein
MTNLKIKAAIETAKLIFGAAAIALVISMLIYSVPLYVLATGAGMGVLLYLLHMVYEFKLETLTAAEKKIDNKSV